MLTLRLAEIPTAPLIALKQGISVVGRSLDCDIILQHPSISRRHAELEIHNGDLAVRDLDSHNGTFVDHQKVTLATVKIGQRLQFGHLAFFVSFAESDDLETADHSDLSEVDDELPLSRGQRDVFALLLRGLTEKAIARQLGLSPHTVHNHTTAIYQRLGVKSRPELLVRFGHLR